MSWTKLNVVTPRSFHLTACQRAGMKCSSSMETPLGEGLRPKLRSPDARGDFQSPAEASPALGLRAGAGQSSEGWPWLGGTCELRWCLGGLPGRGVCVCRCDGNTASALGEPLLQGGLGQLECLQEQGEGRRSPVIPRGKVKGAAGNLEGVREFRVCLWFALPSSSSPLPACGRQLRSGLSSSSSLVWVWQNKRAKLSALVYKYSGFFGAV